jgi:hypothetical protein
VSKRLVGNYLPGLADRGNGALQVDRVPKNNAGHHEIQPTGAMPLVFVRAVPQPGGDCGWKGDVPIMRLNTGRIRKLGWVCRMQTRDALRSAILAMLADLRNGRK